MFLMISQILKSVDSSKTQKSKFLENEPLFFLQINEIVNYTSGAIINQKTVFSGGNL